MDKELFAKISRQAFLWFLYIKKWGRLLKGQTRYFFEFFSQKLKLSEIGFFLAFLRHDYSAKQFSPLNIRQNLRLLYRIRPNEGLTSTKEGQLKLLSGRGKKWLFFLKNALLMGALQKRVERVIYYTYLTITLELNNPFDQRILNIFLQKKLAFLYRLLNYVKTINGKQWDQTAIKQHIEVFERNSLLQAEVIQRMRLAVKKQKPTLVLMEAQAALKKGLYPVLVTQGVSGSYWMRGLERQILGLFKPFDEEIHAPHNPVGPGFRGALGLRKTRVGCRVGESPHHEVGAYLIDEFFGFGIVPKTYYAEFTHHIFYLSSEDRYSFRKTEKTKYGSFQEFVGGFVPLEKLSREEIASIPLDEFQLLIVLDVILGNTDRNAGNILFGDEKIAAIDHGLCFPDTIDTFNFWYWSYFSQGKQPLFRPIVDLLNHFPFDKLSAQLHKKCFISLEALQCLRERVVLFTAAINAGLVPAQLGDLFTHEYLKPLKGLKSALEEAAVAQVQLYRENYPP